MARDSVSRSRLGYRTAAVGGERPQAFSAMTRKRPDALITFASPLTSAYRPIIVEFALKQRLPTMFGLRAAVEAGGLMSYFPPVAGGGRRAAPFNHPILEGAQPRGLPPPRPPQIKPGVKPQTAPNPRPPNPPN